MIDGKKLEAEIKEAAILATAPETTMKVRFTPANINARGFAIGFVSELGQHLANRKEFEYKENAKLILECLRYLATKDSYYELTVSWETKTSTEEGYIMEATVKIKMFYGPGSEEALVFDITANQDAKEAHLAIMSLPTSGAYIGRYKKQKL